jgi:hypothetical protein
VWNAKLERLRVRAKRADGHATIELGDQINFLRTKNRPWKRCEVI